LVFLEGFREQVAETRSIYKIALVKSPEEIAEDLKIFDPILAFVGPCQLKSGLKRIPCADARNDPKSLADLIERVVKKKGAEKKAAT
jgi:hypothetical protein